MVKYLIITLYIRYTYIYEQFFFIGHEVLTVLVVICSSKQIIDQGQISFNNTIEISF